MCVCPPVTGLPLHRLLPLAGLRWSYSNLLPDGLLIFYLIYLGVILILISAEALSVTQFQFILGVLLLEVMKQSLIRETNAYKIGL
jgi:hypothetical protein